MVGDAGGIQFEIGWVLQMAATIFFSGFYFAPKAKIIPRLDLKAILKEPLKC